MLSTDLMRAITEHNLGAALQSEDRLDEAIARYRRAIAIRSDYAPAYNNLGTALRAAGQGPDAIASYERALALPPAPRSQYGWNYLPYVIAWSQQIGEFLQAHVQASREVPQLAERINAEENIPLWEVSGWHD